MKESPLKLSNPFPFVFFSLFDCLQQVTGRLVHRHYQVTRIGNLTKFLLFKPTTLCIMHHTLLFLLICFLYLYKITNSKDGGASPQSQSFCFVGWWWSCLLKQCFWFCLLMSFNFIFDHSSQFKCPFAQANLGTKNI